MRVSVGHKMSHVPIVKERQKREIVMGHCSDRICLKHDHDYFAIDCAPSAVTYPCDSESDADELTCTAAISSAGIPRRIRKCGDWWFLPKVFCAVPPPLSHRLQRALATSHNRRPTLCFGPDLWY